MGIIISKPTVRSKDFQYDNNSAITESFKQHYDST